MKTAISIRDDVFESAERVARRLGVSRSELYTRAVREYLSRLPGEQVTERLNAVYEGADESASSLDDTLAALQLRSLGDEDWP